jgi:arylsulfatase A-like enzyme
VNSPFRGGKGSFFEGGIRVPLFLQWPSLLNTFNAKYQKNLIVKEKVHHVDIFTTILSAVGILNQKILMLIKLKKFYIIII